MTVEPSGGSAVATRAPGAISSIMSLCRLVAPFAAVDEPIL